MLIQLVVTPVTAIMDTPEMALCVQVHMYIRRSMYATCDCSMVLSSP